MGEEPKKLALETKDCGRCGGTGHYSFCQRFGTVCFGCGGKKIVLTKRGRVAAEFLRWLRSLPARDVKVGDVIEVHGMTAGCELFDYDAPVTAVEPGETKYSTDGGVTWLTAATVVFTTEHKRFGKGGASYAPDTLVYRRAPKAERIATMRVALEYQGTLTDRGTYRTRPELTPEQKAERAEKAAARKEAKRLAKNEAAAKRMEAVEALLAKPEVEAALEAWVREAAPTWLPAKERTMLAYVRWLRNHGHHGKAAVVIEEAAAKSGG